MLWFTRRHKITGGNVYASKGPPNIVNGQSACRGVGTVIDWEHLQIDPVAQIEANLLQVKQRFKVDESVEKIEPVALVAYGHTLHETWPQIAEYKTIFTCSGAHKFLLKRGVQPTFHVESDPQSHKKTMLGPPCSSTQYLIASIVDPAYVSLLLSVLPDSQITLWHILCYDPPILKVLPSREPLITGGDTVGPRMMKIAKLMGYRNMHFFGFDACADPLTNQTHADVHPKPKAFKLESYEFNDKDYVVREDWLVHAETMLDDLDRLPEVKYRFHGTNSLLREMAEAHVPVKRARLPLFMEKG